MSLRRIHAIAAIWSMLWICGLIILTLGVELTRDPAAIALAKRLVLFGMLLLAPVMITLGWAGRRMAAQRGDPALKSKQRRVLLVSGNGVLVLIPCALTLDHLAQAGAFGPAFYLLKGLLVAAGSSNLILLALNFRDGLRMARQSRAIERLSLQPASL